MYYREKTLKFLLKILKRLPEKISFKFTALLDSFIQGLDVLKNGGHIFLALFLSIVSWSANGLFFFLVGRAMGIENVTVISSAFIMGVVSLGISIPAAPGYVGTYQYFGSLALRILGVSKSVALSFIVLDHALRLVGITAGGLFFLARDHISVAQLDKKAKKASQEE